LLVPPSDCPSASLGLGGGGGGGGGGGKTSGTPSASKAQITNACLSQFYSTPSGKTLQFFSPLQMIPGFGQDPATSTLETTVGLGSKATVITAAANAGQRVIQTLFADSWSLVGPIEKVVSWLGTRVLSFAKAGGPTIWGYGAGLDALAHAGCSTIARQETGQMTPTPVSGGAIP